MEAPDLFGPGPEADETMPGKEDLLGPFGIRARLVTLNTVGAPPNQVNLNMFSGQEGERAVFSGRTRTDAAVFVALLSVESDATGSVASGRLVSDDDSTVTMAIVNGSISLSINSPKFGLFEAVAYRGRTHIVRQIDGEKLPDCGVKGSSSERDTRQAESSPAGDTQGGARADGDPIQIDVMVIYTRKAENELHGADGAVARAKESVLRGNNVLRNSGLNVVLRLVRAQPVDYDEVDDAPDDNHGFLQMLNAIIDGTQAGLKNIHTWRNESKADVVCLLVANAHLGGLAYPMSVPNASAESTAYAVVNLGSASQTWSLVHEIGHLFGCFHEDDGGKLYALPHAFPDPVRWKTVMFRLRTAGDRIPYFSNPDVSFNGCRTGIAGAHDHARVIRESAAVVAAFR
jgi:hypothetical protein